MEDLQNRQSGGETPRRRRAVRTVPMGNTQTQSAQPEQQSQPIQPTRTDAAPIDAAPPVSAADEVLLSAEDSIFEKVNTDEDESVPASADDRIPSTSDAPDAADAPLVEPAVPMKEIFSAEQTFSQDNAPLQPKPRRRTALWTAIGVTAALLMLCAAAILPFLRRTEAVMLYVDGTAIGYIASEQTAAGEFTAVLDDLRDSTAQPFDAQLAYRCETESVQGDVLLLSSDAIYDAMYAQATDGYVRAYRLYAEDGSISYAFGVMTEAEILSAFAAAETICRERYAANLPTEATLTVVSDTVWDTAWIAEDAILDEGALISRIVESQESEYPMFSVTAEMTETEAERIPYETTLVPNDENFDGIRTMISPGADGLAQVSYTVSLDPLTGAVLSRTECARVVVREPVSAVSYEGLYPLPDGVSTGTFSWPLPELPDDELPLDENGNPYTPENPLALKNTYVSSGYGWRILWGADDFHLGLDIVAPAYTEIYAADGGVVVFAAFTSSYGYMTRIRHANNVETVYAHQIKQTVKAGDVVEKGQLIGYVGATGNTSGSHLHLEFRRDHVTVDPLEYITIPEDVLVLGEGY